MLLHHYLGSTHGPDALENCELFASRVTSFNDPFELSFELDGSFTHEEASLVVQRHLASRNLVADLKGGSFKVKDPVGFSDHAAKGLVQRLNDLTYLSLTPIIAENAEKNIRMVCFCDAEKVEPHNDILMWSHYADKHRGIRITLEVSPKELEPYLVCPVSYETTRVKIDRKFDYGNPALEVGFRKSLSTKSHAWAYENEVRLLAFPKACKVVQDGDSTKEFIPLQPKWIKAVDIGCKAQPVLIERVTAAAKKSYPSAALRMAKIHPANYSLVYEKPT
jgi:hypothetical protein